MRFSTVAGNKGSADLARDVRGFAVKLYTKQGNWDIVGNNIPVFFIQDAIKFPDLIHAAKQEPDRGFPQAQTAHDNFWDFVSLMPESMHMLMWVMSDRAIPRSFRFMEGFGVHTFRLVERGGPVDVREVPLEAEARAAVGGVERGGQDQRRRSRLPSPRSVERDPSPATSRNGSSACSSSTTSSPTGSPSTCSTRPSSFPKRRCRSGSSGGSCSTACVDNFFAETEQVAFCTQNIVAGVDFTNDPLLQGRNFSYLDTQLKRLGSPNFTHLPINAPKCPFAHFQQDGHMAMHQSERARELRAELLGRRAEGGPREDPDTGFRSFPAEENGREVRRLRPESFADHYSQARQFYISQTPVEQEHIARRVRLRAQQGRRRPPSGPRMVANLRNVDEDLARQVADGLGLDAARACRAGARPVTDLGPSGR